MPHLRPGVGGAKEQTASIKIGAAMVGDALRGAFADPNEFRKIGETHDEIVLCVIEPVSTAASQRRVFTSRVAVFLEPDRRDQRLSFECYKGAVEAIDDPPLHLPSAEEEVQPARAFPLFFGPRKHSIFLFL
ncbi:hypothetical protein RHSP_32265 [Rhizobium freirei PRF 81]|uniref:Uncharacterized protein n=1 Tax=Rhizobium freirei PRF 81 TaxID=363754 RepID=N6UZG7_9HYPH|nr:hypothetical protein RHSP_32265 [Rhizobium freirei PRF 81]